jgi:hypothetical protein
VGRGAGPFGTPGAAGDVERTLHQRQFREDISNIRRLYDKKPFMFSKNQPSKKIYPIMNFLAWTGAKIALSGVRVSSVGKRRV